MLHRLLAVSIEGTRQHREIVVVEIRALTAEDEAVWICGHQSPASFQGFGASY